MANHSSATVREHTSHANQTSRTNTIGNALKRRAQAVVNDKSIDPQSRAIIRYALEVNDPWLAELVRRADAGDAIVDTFDFQEPPEPNEDDSKEEKIEALTEMICRAVTSPTLNPLPCSCSWRRLKIPRTRKHSRTQRNISRSLAAVS